MRCILLLLIFFTGKTVAQQSIISSKLQHVLLPGIPDSVYEGYYGLFENRSTNSGRKIKIYIIVIPSVNKTNRPPIFFIEGGPGVAATKNTSWLVDKTMPYRQNNDVVLIDARGTGNSNPLHCPSLEEKNNLQDQFSDMYPADAVKDCYQLLSKENDLKQYHTTNVIRDIEEIRKWLGYKKITLFGLSYGTRLSLQYMRMFPAALSSVVLWSPTPTYAKMPLYHAKFAQQALTMIWNDCKNDNSCNSHYPNINNEFNKLMKRWKKRPVDHVWADSLGNLQTVTIPWDAFQTKIRSLMYSPVGIRIIPYVVHQAWKGNLEPFVTLYPKGKSSEGFLAEGFYLCVTCTEDVPFIKNGETENETAGTFMGTYRIAQQQQACANWTGGTISHNFLKPVASTVPTLILSGAFDPVTPTVWAKEIAAYLPNSKLVIIPNMAHVFDGLSNESCFDNLVMEFITNPRRKKLNTGCVKEMLPPAYKIKE
ncbi:MAG: alpha/beta hydrolase [Chitinophagaceae bacterium]|nr:alpha/beta hydrolase [Chitinophagaceae bacterium]